MQAPITTAFSIALGIVVFFFAVEKGTMLYEEYVIQALIIEKDMELLQRCETAEGYAKMNHHANFCERIITTARVGAFWHALNKVAGSLPTHHIAQCIENTSWKVLLVLGLGFMFMPTLFISACRAKHDPMPYYVKAVP